MRKIITVYSLLIFVGLDLVCIKCNQFIHPVKDEEYEILLKLCKGEFSVLVADRSKLQKPTIIKFWRNREKFSQNKNMLFYDGKKVLQFVSFKALGYCFEETIGFDLKALFASCPVSRLIR